MNTSGEVFIRLFASSGRLLGLRRRTTIARMVEAKRAKWIGENRARLFSVPDEEHSGENVESTGHWYKRNPRPDVAEPAQMLFHHRPIESEA
jgi:hypothetical protein